MSDISEFLRKCADEADDIRDYVGDSLGSEPDDDGFCPIDWDCHKSALRRLEKLQDLLLAKATEIEGQEAS
ncbi:MAG: hypothetical protein LBP92_05905 [Deltaproteobacteria bacterium]|jgi:hypothetical protein|nr:hypothetical protein [Deltaproteobacteria bacterium]